MAEMASPPPDPAPLLAELRASDRDRYLATLFAPHDSRAGLAALYAFNQAIASVREAVSDPLPGEMRLQWWRDLLAGQARGDPAGHPVASALIDTVERYRLPREALGAMIDARSADLYDDPPATLGDLEGYCGETAALPMRLASLILAGGLDPGGADSAGTAGVAYGLTGLLRAFPWHAAAGRLALPADLMQRHGLTRDAALSGDTSPPLLAVLSDLRALALRRWREAAAGAGQLARVPRLALLPGHLVPAYLEAMERPGYDPFRTRIDLPDLRKLWILWRGSR